MLGCVLRIEGCGGVGNVIRGREVTIEGLLSVSDIGRNIGVSVETGVRRHNVCGWFSRLVGCQLRSFGGLIFGKSRWIHKSLYLLDLVLAFHLFNLEIFNISLRLVIGKIRPHYSRTAIFVVKI